MANYEQVVQEYMAEDQARYDREVADAKAQAEASWAEMAAQKTSEFVAQLDTLLANAMGDNGEPLDADAKTAQRGFALAKFEKQLAQEKADYINMSVTSVQPVEPEFIVRGKFAFLQETEMPVMGLSDMNVDLSDNYYRLADGRIYSVKAVNYVSSAPDGVSPIDVPGGTEEALKTGILEFYGMAVPAFMKSEEELFAELRAERDKRIAATDYLFTSDYPISAIKKTAYEAYRTALRDLPGQPGAPWDGGGENTPWPKEPVVGTPAVAVKSSGKSGENAVIQVTPRYNTQKISVSVPALDYQEEITFEGDASVIDMSVPIPMTVGAGSILQAIATAYDSKGNDSASATVEFTVL